LAQQQTIWRISVVRVYSAPPKKRKSNDTPIPFCEMRAFVFLPKKPSIYELKPLNNGLTQAINYTENLFQSIYTAREQDALEQDDSLEEHGIRMHPATPRTIFEIQGYECQPIDAEEAMKHFSDERQQLKFFDVYRYTAFFNLSGNPEKEYGEQEILEIQRVTQLQQSQQQIP
jgi:hypothetical protein